MKDVLANAEEGDLGHNLDKMKKWTGEDVKRGLDKNNNLTKIRYGDDNKRYGDSKERELISESRKLIVDALELLVRKKKEEGIDLPKRLNSPIKLRQLAKRLTTKENILSKFKKVEIELK